MTKTTLLLSAMIATSGVAFANGTSVPSSGTVSCPEDVDNDGYSSGYFVESETGDCNGDGMTANLGLELDCDDNNARVYPDASEFDFDCDVIDTDASAGCDLEFGDIVKIENNWQSTCGNTAGIDGCFMDAVVYWPELQPWLEVRASEETATEFIVTDTGDGRVKFEVWHDHLNGALNYFDDSQIDILPVPNGTLSTSEVSNGRGTWWSKGAINTEYTYGHLLSGNQESCLIRTGGSRPDYMNLGLESVTVVGDGRYPAGKDQYTWTMHVQ